MDHGSQIARLAVARHHVDGVPAVHPTLHQGHNKGVAQCGHLHAHRPWACVAASGVHDAVPNAASEVSKNGSCKQVCLALWYVEGSANFWKHRTTSISVNDALRCHSLWRARRTFFRTYLQCKQKQLVMPVLEHSSIARLSTGKMNC